MKIIILAAGMGSRLGDPENPKPLTLLENGKSLLEQQLERFTSFRHQVIIVVGYQKEKIMERFPDLLYVYSPRFAEENTSKSLLRALYKVDEDLLWVNGDVVFHPSILDQILALNKTCMVVNVGSVGEEEVKYRTDRQGYILEVSKEIAQAQGEALGINYFKKTDLAALREGLERCADRDYFEKGVEWAIQQGTKVLSLPIESNLCTEVDFPEDLKRANAMIKSW